MLLQLQKIIGGKMYVYPNKGLNGEARLAITDLPTLRNFLTLIFQNSNLLITARQRARLQLILQGLTEQIYRFNLVEQFDE